MQPFEFYVWIILPLYDIKILNNAVMGFHPKKIKENTKSHFLP